MGSNKLLSVDKQHSEFLANIWSDKFDLGVFKTARRMLKGFKNKNFLITSSKGKFVLKIYAVDYLSKDYINNIALISNELKNTGLPVLSYINGKNQQFAQSKKQEGINRYFLVSRYVGEQLPILVNDKILKTMSCMLVKLHKALGGIDHFNKTKTLDVMLTVNKLSSKKAIKTIESYFTDKKDRDEFIKEYLSEISFLRKNIPANVDMQLLHGDFNLKNIHFINGRINTIFDFDEIVVAPPSHELATSIYNLVDEYHDLKKLLEIYVRNYNSRSANKASIEDVKYFLRLKASYRLGRYFSYYRFTDAVIKPYAYIFDKLLMFRKIG